jgi:hypothetical protein
MGARNEAYRLNIIMQGFKFDVDLSAKNGKVKVFECFSGVAYKDRLRRGGRG